MKPNSYQHKEMYSNVTETFKISKCSRAQLSWVSNWQIPALYFINFVFVYLHVCIFVFHYLHLTDGDSCFSPLSWILFSKFSSTPYHLYLGRWPWCQRRWMEEPKHCHPQPRWQSWLKWSHPNSADSLARNGVVLEQHYAQFQCTPSRAALMTSRLLSMPSNVLYKSLGYQVPMYF